MSISHHDVKDLSEHRIASSFHGQWGAKLAWAPFPSAWQQVYAYIHETCFFRSHPNRSFDKPHDLRLVDAGAHKVFRSWTAEDLRQLTCRRILRSTPPYGQLCTTRDSALATLAEAQLLILCLSAQVKPSLVTLCWMQHNERFDNLEAGTTALLGVERAQGDCKRCMLGRESYVTRPITSV